eukprot:TRINITY_DN5586_c0_g1_i1.p1 TRINITY_DN5586_c0_g1~~TRINITY_DN5586_c0_g1_i1.p1  ORF type:complete len:227 (-),score=5.14 TRINITY_DN5586_c0_g1_i1:272-952(-)
MVHSIVYCFLSAFASSLYGMCVGIIVSNSLVEISNTVIFSIIFGVAFFLLGGAIMYRSLRSIESKPNRTYLLIFSTLVIISGIFCFLLQQSWLKFSYVVKIPMYASIGLSLSFAMAFLLVEILNVGLCDKCSGTDFQSTPVVGTKKQVLMIFAGSLIMGIIFGVLFGTIDVESKVQLFNKIIILSLPIGASLGFVFGFTNQWIRNKQAGESTEKMRLMQQHDTLNT